MDREYDNEAQEIDK